MADYSIDDILAELDAKKSGNKSSYADTESETEKSSSYDISATSIIEGLGSNEITEDELKQNEDKVQKLQKMTIRPELLPRKATSLPEPLTTPNRLLHPKI